MNGAVRAGRSIAMDRRRSLQRLSLLPAVLLLPEQARAGGQLEEPLIDSVQAVSVGVVGGVPMLDLPYAEDSTADTDMNVVMSGDGRFIEVQGTAEGIPFDRVVMNELLDLAAKGCAELGVLQREALAQ